MAQNKNLPSDVVECPERTVCLVLYQFVYVGDVSGDTSNIIWPDDGRSISGNIANINKLVQDKTKLFFQNILQLN